MGCGALTRQPLRAATPAPSPPRRTRPPHRFPQADGNHLRRPRTRPAVSALRGQSCRWGGTGGRDGTPPSPGRANTLRPTPTRSTQQHAPPTLGPPPLNTAWAGATAPRKRRAWPVSAVGGRDPPRSTPPRGTPYAPGRRPTAVQGTPKTAGAHDPPPATTRHPRPTTPEKHVSGGAGPPPVPPLPLTPLRRLPRRPQRHSRT
ncbi:hypothetical protein SHKM778_12220 [Streptomyces sp. KM77-8]|uniref:Uncharacterized protein n=1 Tax=Streptomyces haneummycinicus TaxID=3074435 RepID=A0AAT9HBQ8_9ACTN